MKINITKKQYEFLLKAVYLGNWVTNANRVDDQINGMNELEGYIFSFAKDFGFERWADTDDPTMTYPTSYFEEESGVRELIDEYDNDGFWDELADQLGQRDFFEKYSREEIEAMDQEEYFMKKMGCIIAWEEELETHGLDRLRKVVMAMKTKDGSKNEAGER